MMHDFCAFRLTTVKRLLYPVHSTKHDKFRKKLKMTYVVRLRFAFSTKNRDGDYSANADEENDDSKRPPLIVAPTATKLCGIRI